LTVLLTANGKLESELVPGDEQMPDRIPVGDIHNDKNLPDIQNLLEVLRQAAHAYPVVLVDIPPILVSVDAEFIARSADVTVLVIEADSVNKAELTRAAKSLERINPKAVSAVMNRVRGEAAGGFANAALQEFKTGTPPGNPSLLRQLLWG
jgi:MinD-like ATPase involved in chromosome partitioning or flagellar assembly